MKFKDGNARKQVLNGLLRSYLLKCYSIISKQSLPLSYRSQPSDSDITVAKTDTIPCRLCGSSSRRVFTREVLKKYQIGYFQCECCYSMQTEQPYWLAEAYDPRNEQFDTGQVIRSLMNAAFLAALKDVLGIHGRVIDFGCGSGLLVRLLRDIGIDAWGMDPYSPAQLASAFKTEHMDDFAIVNLCEVAEHFDEPAAAFEQIFASNPLAVVIQTALFEKPDENWPYLGFYHGQHVFFYSVGGLEFLAKTYRVFTITVNGFILLLRPPLADVLIDHASGQLKPDVKERFQNAYATLFQRIEENQYAFAQQDNLQIMHRFLNTSVIG